MSNPETIEFLSFRRTFTLLVTLVVLPSAGLSGFGVVAIINERAAVEKRLESLWAQRLGTAATRLKAALEDVEGVPTPTGLALRRRTQASGTAPVQLERAEATFVLDRGETHATSPGLATALVGLETELAAVPEHPVVFSIASAQGTLLVAAMRDGERVVGCELAELAMATLVDRVGAELTAGDAARMMLVPVREAVPQGLVARIVSGVSDVRDSALGPRDLASVTMPSPLQDFRLVAVPLGGDPAAQASRRNRIVYGVLLGLFYVALALGVIFTARTLYREAHVSRLKTDFVSLVSHELRTPLTSVRMFVEMLASGRVRDEAERQTVLELLTKETTRLTGMIETVLDWARLESGRRQYHLEAVAASQLLDAAAAAFRTLCHGADMAFTVEQDADLPTVQADADAFSGALLNLLQNAFKYSSEPRRIALRARRAENEVVFEVEDNGAGIPRREFKRIFERFYRVDTLLTRTTQGSGLGLSIAQRIVHAHGGRISVDSVVGRGSVFRIHLPVRTP